MVSLVLGQRLARVVSSAGLLAACTFNSRGFFSNALTGNMARPEVTRSGGTVTVAPPKNTPASAVVVLMHGLGDTCDGFADVAEMWHQQLPHVKFILPTAPTVPVTLNGGMPMPAWYDIVSLSEDRAEQPVQGINESRERIAKMLAAEHEAGTPYNRMALAGFSQGGAMAIYTGLQMGPGRELAGVLAMSGYLAGANEFKLSPTCAATPVLHCHGTGDPMVAFPMAQKTEQAIKAQGSTGYTLKAFSGMGHTVSPEELAVCIQFLGDILPSAETANKNPEDMSIKELKAAISRGGLGTKAVGLREKQELVELLKNSKTEL